jgi:uncharacterized protein YjbI with pentapeptide repeats
MMTNLPARIAHSILFRNISPSVFIFFTIILSGLTLWAVPQLQTMGMIIPDDHRIRLENELRTTLFHIVAAGFVLLGSYVAWRRFSSGQITERFTKAIEQLGSEKLVVRLGGIFALERIAKDSPDRDRWTIIEVLTAYVRENSWTGLDLQDVAKPAYGSELFGDMGEKDRKPRVDIQTVLTVIGKRSLTNGRGDHHRLNLSNADLRNVDLSGCNLKKADFSGAKLKGASLDGANLEEASFYRADLETAKLSNARLKGACFIHANLKDAHLPGTKLKRTNFLMANMKGAFLKRQYFTVTEGKRLNKIYIDGADLSEAMGLTPEQIESALIDETTKLPAYVDSARESSALVG